MSEPYIPMLALGAAKEAAKQVKMSEVVAELNIFRILLHHPYLAKNINDMIMNLIFRGKLAPRLRELIIMRLGWSTRSVYEWTQHWPIALDSDLSEEEVLAVRNWQSYPGWCDLDRAVLSATDETVTSGAISSTTMETCTQLLSDKQELLEMIAAIGTWRMISQVLRSLEVPLEEGKESWPPDGLSPDTV